MAGTGGRRAGAGRPAKATKYERPINKAEKKIVDKLESLVDNLLKLAAGGQELVQEEWQPAGTVMKGSGEFATLAFPNLPADQMVMVKRTVTIAGMDRAANAYLLDRIMGKPTQKQEITAEISTIQVEYVDPVIPEDNEAE